GEGGQRPGKVLPWRKTSPLTLLLRGERSLGPPLPRRSGRSAMDLPSTVPGALKWKLDGADGPLVCAGFDGDVAVVRLSDPAGDGEAQPATRSLAGIGGCDV